MFYHSVNKHPVETTEVPHSRLLDRAQNTHTEKIVHLSKKEGKRQRTVMKDPGLEEISEYFYLLQIKIIITPIMVVQGFIGVYLALNYEKHG